MSEISVRGFDGVSRKNNFVLLLTALRHSSTLVGETNVVSTPKRDRMPPNSWIVAPNTAFEHTTWSPAFRCTIAVARIADMPEAVATQASAATGGLVTRE